MDMNLARLASAVAYNLKRAADENDDEKKEPAGAKSESEGASRRRRARARAEDLVPMQGIGRGLADYLAPGTFGGTRAGRATMIARALGQEPNLSVTNPNTDKALIGGMFGLGGGVLGGLVGGLGGALTGDLDNATLGALGGAGIGAGLGYGSGVVASGSDRREEMQHVQDSLAKELEGHGTSRLKLNPPQYSALSSILMPYSGPHRAGQADAYEALKNNTRYSNTPGRHAGYAAQYLGTPYAAGVGGAQGIAQNFSARKRMKQTPQPPIEDNYGLDEFGPGKAANAFKFGVKLAMDPRLMGGLGGAALGAGVGGLAGLVNPGVDESGKRKSRMGSALMGALGGAGVGGLGGAAVGHFAPNQTQQFGSQIAGLLGGGKTAPSEAEQAHNRQMKALNQLSSQTSQRQDALVHAVGGEPMGPQ